VGVSGTCHSRRRALCVADCGGGRRSTTKHTVRSRSSRTLVDCGCLSPRPSWNLALLAQVLSLLWAAVPRSRSGQALAQLQWTPPWLHSGVLHGLSLASVLVCHSLTPNPAPARSRWTAQQLSPRSASSAIPPLSLPFSHRLHSLFFSEHRMGSRVSLKTAKLLLYGGCALGSASAIALLTVLLREWRKRRGS
jgi:hypothetical protein